MDNDNEPIHAISMGAGVQSSCMALMAKHGEIEPMPDFAIFSDTQGEAGYKTRNNPKGEREGLYAWLDWLEGELPFPVYTVTGGNLTEDSLRPRERQKDSDKGKKGEVYMKRLIPLFGLMPNGEKTAAIGRKCTADYKLKPLIKELRKRCGIKRGEKEVVAVSWLGISWDEIQRMKDSHLPWVDNRFPLIEKKMSRHHCLEWMKEKGYPEPPRSACFYCPFHGDDEWRKLRNEDPVHFKDAIAFDRRIRENFKQHDPVMKMEVFLHNSCRPLGEVDFDNDEDKGQLTWDFSAECEGLCGT
jgi:hypothetical protein